MVGGLFTQLVISSDGDSVVAGGEWDSLLGGLKDTALWVIRTMFSTYFCQVVVSVSG